MNNVTKLIPTVVLIVTVFSVTLFANTQKGQNVFLKKLKTSCSLTGINSSTKFTMKHTQDEWEEIKQAGKFTEEIRKICPHATGKLNSVSENDLYDFAYEYASDSGNVPSN